MIGVLAGVVGAGRTGVGFDGVEFFIFEIGVMLNPLKLPMRLSLRRGLPPTRPSSDDLSLASNDWTVLLTFAPPPPPPPPDCPLRLMWIWMDFSQCL